jgi:hypothetical protein
MKLKKVQPRAELAKKHGVAPPNELTEILRKRMENCLGVSDSSSESGSPTANDEEWDE